MIHRLIELRDCDDFARVRGTDRSVGFDETVPALALDFVFGISEVGNVSVHQAGESGREHRLYWELPSDEGWAVGVQHTSVRSPDFDDHDFLAEGAPGEEMFQRLPGGVQYFPAAGLRLKVWRNKTVHV